jgi:exosome complex exonuclease RRP6
VKARPNIAERKHLPKPQLTFDNVPTNDETGPFRPLLVTKPHAKIPLEQCLKTFRDSRGRKQHPHPYQTEIEKYEFPKAVYEYAEPQQYPPFEETTATFVDTPEAVEQMLAELKTAKELAIDLEHHDNRSYIGMVSLMQISTREKDWIVDTLKPWRRKLECLNEVFADPNILKVLHGSFMDVIWLQRDLGLYLVGLFDTYHAARSLGYPGASLAYLLERHVNFKAQKQYQMADWRTRPLSKELFDYARADTHFLLYIYDKMRNELVEKSDFSDPDRNKVHDVQEKSKEYALQRYEHPIYDRELGLGGNGWYKVISKSPVTFTPQQFAVFKAVHEWRDTLSRKEDESTFFVMPNHALFSIARAMPLDKPALYTAIQHVSHIVRSHADELVAAVARAKEEGVNGPELATVLTKVSDMLEAEKAAKYAEETPKKAAPVPVVEANASAPLESGVVEPATRSTLSSFWGPLWSSHQNFDRQRTIDVALAVPLPPLTAEIFDGKPESITPKAEKPQFVRKEDRPQEDQRTDMFVVKQLGGKKRKRAEASEAGTPAKPALDRHAKQPARPRKNRRSWTHRLRRSKHLVSLLLTTLMRQRCCMPRTSKQRRMPGTGKRIRRTKRRGASRASLALRMRLRGCRGRRRRSQEGVKRSRDECGQSALVGVQRRIISLHCLYIVLHHDTLLAVSMDYSALRGLIVPSIILHRIKNVNFSDLYQHSRVSHVEKVHC